MENERLLLKIEELMKQRGYSRYRLSQLSGIKQSTLTTMFNKRSTVSIDTLTKISKAFGMRCSEFLSLVEDGPDENTAKDFPVCEWEALNKERKHVVVLMMRLLKMSRLKQNKRLASEEFCREILLDKTPLFYKIRTSKYFEYQNI